jgi:hypothetical protein
MVINAGHSSNGIVALSHALPARECTWPGSISSRSYSVGCLGGRSISANTSFRDEKRITPPPPHLEKPKERKKEKWHGKHIQERISTSKVQ